MTAAFLRGEETPAQFAVQAWTLRQAYNGFNLFLGDADALWYVASEGAGPRELGAGIYGLSNHLLDTPWPKVVGSKARFEAALQGDDPEAGVFELLADRRLADDDGLPDTGVGLELERGLSAPFIVLPGYGTRSSTFVARSASDSRLVERQFGESGAALVRLSR